jgi:hypothetical protein
MKEIPEQHKIYHHWAYDPYMDEAYIDGNQECDQQGYVYRIDGGWRLTDKDHDAVDDPYLVRKVMDALRGDDPEPIAPDDFNFNQLHYGQPVPMEGM